MKLNLSHYWKRWDYLGLQGWSVLCRTKDPPTGSWIRIILHIEDKIIPFLSIILHQRFEKSFWIIYQNYRFKIGCMIQ